MTDWGVAAAAAASTSSAKNVAGSGARSRSLPEHRSGPQAALAWLAALRRAVVSIEQDKLLSACDLPSSTVTTGEFRDAHMRAQYGPGWHSASAAAGVRHVEGQPDEVPVAVPVRAAALATDVNADVPEF